MIRRCDTKDGAIESHLREIEEIERERDTERDTDRERGGGKGRERERKREIEKGRDEGIERQTKKRRVA